MEEDKSAIASGEAEGRGGALRKFRAAVDAVSFVSHVGAAKTAEQDVEQRDDSNLTSAWGTVRSLINAAVSGGVLALAYQIPRAGSVSTTLLIVISAVLLYESLMMLFNASLHYNTSSYTGTVKRAWGKKAARAVAVSLGLGQFGILVGYANVLANTLPWVIQYNAYGCVDSDPTCDLPVGLRSWFLIALLNAIFIIPVSLRSSPDVFSKISFTTFIHFALFLGLVIWGAAVYWPSNHVSEVYTMEEAKLGNLSVSSSVFPEETSVFKVGADPVLTIAVLAFAMECHTTGLPILYGTRIKAKDGGRPTQDRQREVTMYIVAGSMLAVAVYYIVIMLGSYIAFGNLVGDNALSSFPEAAAFAQVVRVTYTFELATSIPIYVFSMRRDVMAALLDVEGGQAEMDRIESEHWLRTALITVGLIIVSTVLGVLGSLSLILGFTGALVTSFNTYVLPAMLYYSTGRPGWERGVAIPLAVFGLFVSGIGLYRQITILVEDAAA